MSVIDTTGITVTRTGEQGAFGGELLTVNFGPHHPSTHGVLRLIVDLDGEQIKRVQPDRALDVPVVAKRQRHVPTQPRSRYRTVQIIEGELVGVKRHSRRQDDVLRRHVV